GLSSVRTYAAATTGPTPGTVLSTSISGYFSRNASTLRSISLICSLSNSICLSSGMVDASSSTGTDAAACLGNEAGEQDGRRYPALLTRQRVTGPQQVQVLLTLHTAMMDRRQKLRVGSGKARQPLRIVAIVLALAGGNRRDLASVRHDHLMA